MCVDVFCYEKIGILNKNGIGQRGFARLRGENSVLFSSTMTSASVNMLIQQSL